MNQRSKDRELEKNKGLACYKYGLTAKKQYVFCPLFLLLQEDGTLKSGACDVQLGCSMRNIIESHLKQQQITTHAVETL